MNNRVSRDTPPPEAGPDASHQRGLEADLRISQPSGLGMRLALMLVLAVLPIGFLSILMTHYAQVQSDQTHLQAAIGKTLQAGANEIKTLRSAETATRLLAATLATREAAIADSPDPQAQHPSCTALLAPFARSEVSATLLAYIPLDGLTDCTSDGSLRNFAKLAEFKTYAGSPHPAIFTNPAWSDSDDPAIILTHPVINRAGLVTGMALIRISSHTMQQPNTLEPYNPLEKDEILTILDSHGQIIYASSRLKIAEKRLPLPEILAPLGKGGIQSFYEKASDGTPHLYASVPFTGGLHILGIFNARQSLGWYEGFGRYLITALLGLAGLAVAIFGSQQLVTRHLQRLSSAMKRFSAGDYLHASPQLNDPPKEIAALAEAFHAMTSTITANNEHLEMLVQQKAALLREVHHRTGNSLQLIASILRMHRRESNDPAVQLILDDLHARVMTLSSVHMGLYRMAGQPEVAVDKLMGDVIGKIGLIFGRSGRKGRSQSELDPLMLPAQKAVPLALLLAEILSAFPVDESDSAQLSIRLTLFDQAQARLSVLGPATARPKLTGEGADAPSLIAARLIRGFVQQLNGDLTLEDRDNQIQVCVAFAVSDQPLKEPETANNPPLVTES